MNAIELIAGCRAGDAGALDAFMHAYYDSIYRLALSVLNDPAEADDAAQDVVVAVVRGGAYQGQASLKTWLYAMTVNHCRSRLRKRRTRERLLQALQGVFRPAHPAGPDPETIAMRRERASAVWQAVDALDEKHRLPVILYYGHELPAGEIAQVLHISEGTVHSRLYTARARLRAALAAGTDEPDDAVETERP